MYILLFLGHIRSGGRTEGEGEEEEGRGTDGSRIIEDASPTTRAMVEARQLHTEMSKSSTVHHQL